MCAFEILLIKEESDHAIAMAIVTASMLPMENAILPRVVCVSSATTGTRVTASSKLERLFATKPAIKYLNISKEYHGSSVLSAYVWFKNVLGLNPLTQKVFIFYLNYLAPIT